MNETTNEIGKQHLKIDAIPVCAYEMDFEWNSEKVKTGIGGTENRKSLLRNLLGKISELSK